jgi:two-component system LytT family response regulator
MSMAASCLSISSRVPPSYLDVKLRVLIADDEQLSRERLKLFLRTEPGIDIVAECSNGSEAVAAIRQEAPDLAFLDVRMPELDAFGVLQALKDARLPAIILVTAHDQFALRAFEIDAVDYLLKPFDRDRLQAAIRRACRRLRLDSGKGQEPSPQRSSTSLKPGSKPLERITVKSSGRISIVKTTEIDWVSAADNYVELHVGSKLHLLRTTVTALANRLPQNHFSRISRSALVNLDKIKEIQSKSHGDYFVVLHNGVSLAGTRNYRQGLDELLGLRGVR